MTSLLAIPLLFGLTVIPVMIGARVVKARNIGFWAAFWANVFLVALAVAIQNYFSSHVLAYAISVLGGAALLAFALGTTFPRGLAVSIIAAAVQFAVILLTVALFGETVTAT